MKAIRDVILNLKWTHVSLITDETSANLYKKEKLFETLGGFDVCIVSVLVPNGDKTSFMDIVIKLQTEARKGDTL